MAHTEAHTISVTEDELSRLADGEVYIAAVKPASTESVGLVLSASQDSEDGRSGWVWVRLASGDLVLGVFPQGDTYFATELDHS